MHKCTQINNVIQKAKDWAENIWAESISAWIERSSQDFDYRKYVVEPLILKTIECLDLDKKSSIVDIGCGDGAHTMLWRDHLNLLGLKDVAILGIDLFDAMIVKAKENTIGSKNIYFITADVTKKNTSKLIKDLISVPKVVVAMFLLQDISNLEGLLKTVQLTLEKEGHFIAIFIHPNFAEDLVKSGHVKVIADDLPKECVMPSGIVLWKFRGLYPIARKNKPPFYVPYFHRSLQDYCDALKSSGFKIKDNMPLMPEAKVVEKLSKKKILPFVNSKYNIYWPLIINQPSSILIHAVKA